jgi:peptidoglycan/xylan/chitin deacetylase (PgdA/CDA1 family)
MRSSLAPVLSLLGGLLTLGACGRERGAHEGVDTASTHEALVSDATHYVGAGSCGAKQLALTFDDGPGVRTAELSSYLKSEDIRAVFFVNGACVQATSLPNGSCSAPTTGAAQILAQLTADGHLVGNHTTTHRDMTAVPVDQRVQELSETHALIASDAKTPWNRLLFRAPFGAWSGDVATTLQSSPMKGYVGPIYWDIGGYSDQYPNAAADWACFQGSLKNAGGGLIHSAPADPAPDGFATTQECGDAYLKEIKSIGHGIVLMHDQYGWAQGHTVDMVKYLVPILKQAGYTFVRADEIPIVAADLPACADAACSTCSGPGANQCTACAPGRTLSNGACSACATCGAHEYVAAACSGTADTACAECDPTCDTCAGAGPDACARCGPGRFLEGSACKACMSCATGSYVTAACTPTRDADCAPCTTCGRGSFTSAPCTATTDTVCAACDPGCKECTGPGPDGCPASAPAPDASAIADEPQSPPVGDDAGVAEKPGVAAGGGAGDGGCSAALPGPSAGLERGWLAIAALGGLIRRRRAARTSRG